MNRRATLLFGCFLTGLAVTGPMNAQSEDVSDPSFVFPDPSPRITNE